METAHLFLTPVVVFERTRKAKVSSVYWWLVVPPRTNLLHMTNEMPCMLICCNRVELVLTVQTDVVEVLVRAAKHERLPAHCTAGLPENVRATCCVCPSLCIHADENSLHAVSCVAGGWIMQRLTTSPCEMSCCAG